MDGQTAANPIVLAPGAGEKVVSPVDTVVIKASTSETDGAFGAFECIVPPRSAGPPEHIHTSFSEAFYVLEGELSLHIEGRTNVLGAGGFALIPRDIPHGFSNPTDADVRFLVTCTPGGFEGFFAELAELTASGEQDFRAIGELAATYDSHVLAVADHAT